MKTTTVKTTGFKDLDKVLRELGTAPAKRISRAALRKAGRPILDAYKANTVVKTGELVGNEVLGTRLNRRQRRLTPKPGKSELELHIGTADPAGIQQEFGNQHQAANPALTPAWDAHGGEVAVKRIGTELWAGIERQAARAAKAGRA